MTEVLQQQASGVSIPYDTSGSRCPGYGRNRAGLPYDLIGRNVGAHKHYNGAGWEQALLKPALPGGEIDEVHVVIL